MATTELPTEPLSTGTAPALEPAVLRPRRARNEALYFAFRNRKLVVGLSVVLLLLVLAIVGPWLTDAEPFEFGYPTGEPPSSERWLGTTSPGQDVFAQFVYGLRASFLVGAVAGIVAAVIGMAVGFTAGYRGGAVVR